MFVNFLNVNVSLIAGHNALGSPQEFANPTPQVYNISPATGSAPACELLLDGSAPVDAEDIDGLTGIAV